MTRATREASKSTAHKVSKIRVEMVSPNTTFIKRISLKDFQIRLEAPEVPEPNGAQSTEKGSAFRV